jgi:hypothetical protein
MGVTLRAGLFSGLTKLKDHASVARDRETIDSELRLLAAVRRVCREHGGEPSSRQVDELLRRAAREFSQVGTVNRNHTGQSPPQQGSPLGVQYCVPSGAMQGGAP